MKRHDWSKIGLPRLLAAASGMLALAAGAADLPDNDHPVGVAPGDLSFPEEIGNPYRDDREALREGRRSFVHFNCYGCHGGHGGGGMGPSLRDETWLYGSSAADIFDSIAEGRRHSMPAWGVVLPDETIWKMTAYVQSLGSDREPEKPR